MYTKITCLLLSLFALITTIGLGGCAANAAREPTLYQALGGQNGVARLVDAFDRRFLADPRIAALFKTGADEDAYFRERLTEQICNLSGGGCEYTGLPMEEAHSGMAIGEAQFNAFVEDARDAMSSIGLAVATQNRLLALLAPMHKDVIGK
jgi:hemoglobin